jgi:predicted phage gp36 major capsid-like protein
VKAWRLNPKSHTAQEEVRQEKKRAAEKAKQEKSKSKRGKKRSADEAFVVDEGDAKPQQLENGMTLISDLAEAPAFLVGLVGGGSTASTLSVP